MYIIVNRIGDSITGSVNGKSFGVKYSQARYEAMKELQAKSNEAETPADLKQIIEEFLPLTKESYKEIVETKSEYIYVNEATGQFFLKIGDGDKATISKEPLPAPFVDRVISSVEQGIDVLPLIKAWARFLRNPKYSAQKAVRFANYINQKYTDQKLVDELVNVEGVSYEVAKERATGYQTPITQEGLICTYKVSTEITKRWGFDDDGNPIQFDPRPKTIDPITGEVQVADVEFVEDRVFQPVVMGTGGDAFFSGDTKGHTIRVGQVHKLESWDQVDTNDSRSGVKGLHTGNLDYIRGYQRVDTETHYVFVDPMNIGAITDDGSGALRVLEYFVYDSFAGPVRSIYHSSKYAKMTDAAYAAMFAEAVKTYDAERAKLDEKQAQGDALLSI